MDLLQCVLMWNVCFSLTYVNSLKSMPYIFQAIKGTDLLGAGVQQFKTGYRVRDAVCGDNRVLMSFLSSTAALGPLYFAIMVPFWFLLEQMFIHILGIKSYVYIHAKVYMLFCFFCIIAYFQGLPDLVNS